jgi:sugar/nucleoside kinase (ribokinase family)
MALEDTPVDVISFGSVFLELVFGHVRELPRPGEEVFTDEFAISCGGAVTSASAAARGGARAGLATVLGNDLGSRVVTEYCARHAVDLGPSLRVQRRSAGITVVLNFDGDRGFVTHVPPPPEGEQPEVERWREVLHRERPRWCYLHAGHGVAAFLRDARTLGSRVVLDVSLGDERYRDVVLECVALADIFVPNEEELRRLAGAATTAEAVAAGLAWGPDLVVKRGAAGALVASEGTVTAVTEGVRQVAVRDLTGAGDAFAGAMIARLAAGAALTEAVVSANAAGSEAVARLGAVGEVEVAGISTAGRTLGAMFIETLASGGTGRTGAAGVAAGSGPAGASGSAAGSGTAGESGAAGAGQPAHPGPFAGVEGGSPA